MPEDGRLRVLFFVEGFTDIRFVTGLSEVCSLTLAVPARQYAESGLKERVALSGARISVAEIRGGRFEFQGRSLAYLWKHARQFDVILAQEVLRGALNANLVGKLRGVPVITYMCISPAEYFGCRRERSRIGVLTGAVGEFAIRCMMAVNGRLASCSVAMGPYLQKVASTYSTRVKVGLYYGVDTSLFRPIDTHLRTALRERLELPRENFIVLLSSRISHEKDPETVLRAVSIARSKGLDAIVLNIGGGYRDFLELARHMGLAQSKQWVLGRPALHPMSEVHRYYNACDMLAQASLAEGAGLSPLEALACGVPVVATAVGGMAIILKGYARLVPRQDAKAMAEEILWVASNREDAAAQALKGREYVIREWSREKAFADLRRVLEDVSGVSSKQTMQAQEIATR